MSRETILSALALRVGAQRAPWPSVPVGVPYTLLADGQEVVADRDYDQALIRMTVGIHRTARILTDAQRATDANALLEALIIETLGADRTLGGICQDIRYVEGNTEYPSEGTDLVGATALFIIDYFQIC